MLTHEDPRKKDLHNLVNQSFPDCECMMLWNHSPVKDPFKMHSGPGDFNVAVQKVYWCGFHTATTF